MQSIFTYTDYRKYLRGFAAERGGANGRKSGGLRRIAESARIFPSYLSQVLAGRRELSLEQATAIADYCGFDARGRRYFRLLVQSERAGSARLREELAQEAGDLRRQNQELATRLPNQKELSIEDAARLYSSWLYVALRLYTAIPRLSSVEVLAERLRLPKSQVRAAVAFLVRTGLCSESAGKLGYGPTHVHLSADHPLISKHHANWRSRATERHPFLEPEREIAYSGVLALSKKDALKIRALIAEWIASARAVSDPSPSEAVYCLNMDWFEVI